MDKKFKFRLSKEERKYIHFLVVFAMTLCCCMILAAENVAVGCILAFLLCYMPFTFLDWYLEPTEEQKEIQKKVEELIAKMKLANQKLDSIIK